jgi:hypothetical protein
MTKDEAIALIDNLLDASLAYEQVDIDNPAGAVYAQTTYLTARREIFAALIRPTTSPQSAADDLPHVEDEPHRFRPD